MRRRVGGGGEEQRGAARRGMGAGGGGTRLYSTWKEVEPLFRKTQREVLCTKPTARPVIAADLGTHGNKKFAHSYVRRCTARSRLISRRVGPGGVRRQPLVTTELRRQNDRKAGGGSVVARLFLIPPAPPADGGGARRSRRTQRHGAGERAGR
ncbi:hypothetical protein EVAR_89281_1 [Eumeta japonica]|uniref:Uncharacterized protein n=1 Tax=Eumeta variegata TaxID=151549 RepID=A0A4C1YY35_EUMVA|nr:hypothetical protein EVAR_89281_1 [Eumeta japonica]